MSSKILTPFKNFTPFFKKRLGNTCCAFNYVGGCNGN